MQDQHTAVQQQQQQRNSLVRVNRIVSTSYNRLNSIIVVRVNRIASTSYRIGEVRGSCPKQSTCWASLYHLNRSSWYYVLYDRPRFSHGGPTSVVFFLEQKLIGNVSCVYHRLHG